MANHPSQVQKTFTYGDYCTWPEDERWELIDGVPYDMTPAPSRTHSTISVALTLVFGNFLKGNPCHLHVAPFDVRLPKGSEPDDEITTVVQPDLVVICDQSKLDEKGCRGAPDLAIEILSPSTSSKDHIRKRALYERHGVKEFWLIDPTNRIVTVYLLGADGQFGRAAIYSDQDTITTGLFPGLEVAMAEVFPRLPPRIVRESPAEYRAPRND